jgi:hypothetical protein
MLRRLTVSIDEMLETALEEAPERIGVAAEAGDSEKLREYARIGYEHVLENKLDEARLATYRVWADAPELGGVARAAARRAAARGLFEDA